MPINKREHCQTICGLLATTNGNESIIL